jgi:RNA polymerase sigma-70 factor (ECF subfamily)
VFGYSFDEVARVVGRTPAATRQLAARARHAVEARRPRYPAGPDEQRKVVGAFLAATENGDIASLLELLDPGSRSAAMAADSSPQHARSSPEPSG